MCVALGVLPKTWARYIVKPADTTRKADRIQIEALRRLGPEGRLRAGIDLAQTSRKLLLEGLRRRHPEYNQRQIRMAYLRMVLPEGLFLAAYPEARNLLP